MVEPESPAGIGRGVETREEGKGLGSREPPFGAASASQGRCRIPAMPETVIKWSLAVVAAVVAGIFLLELADRL